MNSPSLSTREIEIRRKVVENRAVVKQGIKISLHPHYAIYPCELREWSLLSWHPHYTMYPCELRDWSLLSWHPHPTICLLRWWVSEWESTHMKRERLLELCSGQNGESCRMHSEAERENEGIRGRPKADQRAQWNLGNWATEEERQRYTDEQTKQRWIWTDAENRELKQVNL